MKQKPNRKLPATDPKPTKDEIAATAYQLYVDSGYQNGHDQEHWLQAETILSQKARSASKAPNQSQPIALPWHTEAAPQTAPQISSRPA